MEPSLLSRSARRRFRLRRSAVLRSKLATSELCHIVWPQQASPSHYFQADEYPQRDAQEELGVESAEGSFVDKLLGYFQPTAFNLDIRAPPFLPDLRGEEQFREHEGEQEKKQEQEQERVQEKDQEVQLEKEHVRGEQQIQDEEGEQEIQEQKQKHEQEHEQQQEQEHQQEWQQKPEQEQEQDREEQQETAEEQKDDGQNAIEISPRTFHGIIDDIAAGVVAQYGLDPSDLSAEVAALKNAFSNKDLDAPAYSRQQVQSLMQGVAGRLAMAIPEDAALRVKLLQRIKQGAVKQIDFLPSDGTVVADNGFESKWMRSHMAVLMATCQQHQVKFVSHHTQRSWHSRSSHHS